MPLNAERSYAAVMAVAAVLAPRRNDVLFAAAVVAVSQLEVWGYAAAGGSAAAALTLGLAAVALVLRGRYPVLTTCLVALALTLCANFAGEPFSATSVVTFLAGFFSIGAMPARRRSLVALGIALVLAVFAVNPLTLNDYLAIALSSIALPWLLGALWLRRLSGRREDQRRREAAELAVAAERLRLAQELHDTVSHNVGMIAVQAGAADVLLDKDPAASRRSLHSIEDGARATLLELRRLLGLLRADDPTAVAAPTNLAGLPALIAPLEGAGVRVDLQALGAPVPLPSEVETAAYRVVQESLTNVLAHAGPCQVHVTLRYRPESLGVDVRNDGAATQGPGPGGYGLTGIRERVGALGGSVTAGPRPGGGFEVHALLPLGAR
jgi:signal transduction histidine kinase